MRSERRHVPCRLQRLKVLASLLVSALLNRWCCAPAALVSAASAQHQRSTSAGGAKEVDRIRGSGVFARDPDSLITFTKHEEEDAYTIEMVLRNLPPAKPFVVRWQWPLFRREESLDPAKLKQPGGRPATHSPESLLECLEEKRLTTTE